jgi:hypothetical protein
MFWRLSNRTRLAALLFASLFTTSLAACTGDGSPSGEPDTPGGFDQEVRGGQIHARPLSGVDLARLGTGAVDRAALATILADRDLARVIPAVTPDDLAAVRAVTTRGNGAPLVHLSTRQLIDGVPVHGTYLNLTLRTGRSGPELAASAYHLYAAPRVDTTVQLGEAAALDAARGALRMANGQLRSRELMVFPLDGGLRLVWAVDLAGSDRRALVRANGSRAGEVSVWDDRVFDADGVVRGNVAVGGAPGNQGVPQLLPLRDLSVSDGGASALTGVDGAFALTGTGATVSATLTGPAATVLDATGANVSASAPAGSGVALDLGGTDEGTLAQVTAFHGVTATHQFLVANGLPAADFGAPLVTNTNLNDTCNAYYSPFARTINFFRSGGGCFNSAELSIIAHEYGHFTDDLYGGITEGGLSEGWGDVLACLLRQNPIVGGDIFPGDIIRTCDNAYQYPPGGSDEVHALGQAWAGFVWHARENLIAQLGEAEGDALVRALVLPGLPSNAADIPANIREVFLRDDDDGDLANHTPHWDALLAAANQHGLGFVVDGDLTAPGAVSDLATVAAGITSATLRWTATGDDAGDGTAASYDLRTSAAPITAENFASATPVPAPDPAVAGTMQEATVPVPPGGTIYAALRAIDEAGNQGPISNVVTATAAEGVTIYSDGAESGLGGWTATGLWHVTSSRAASGSSSFWYGQEATGNYETGAANSGVLLSPVIDLAGAELPALVFQQYLHVEDLPQYDQPTVTVRDADDPTIQRILGKTTGYTGGVFVPGFLDLATFTGRRVQIELRFDTIDALYNSTPGWFVDDIAILAANVPEPQPELLINEVLADPPPGWDSGGDGVASTTADEFIELVNIGDAAMDLSGYTVADSLRTRYTFPAGTSIPAGGVLVVLGGGASTLPVPALVAAGLFLNNDGDAVRVRTPAGDLVAELVYGPEGGQNSSLVHSVDGDPLSPVVRHQELAGTPASVGTRSDGSPWDTSTPPPPPPPALVINEILADPAPGYDPSGDGTASSTADEFIEIVNTADTATDVSGLTISDAIGVRVTLPAGVVIPAHGALVVFGGSPVALSIPGVVFYSAGTLALNNAGDTITVGLGGETIASVTYGSEGGADQSLVRAVEGDGASAFVGHHSVSSAHASPGTRADGGAF